MKDDKVLQKKGIMEVIMNKIIDELIKTLSEKQKAITGKLLIRKVLV